jgi:hypothetical protein
MLEAINRQLKQKKVLVKQSFYQNVPNNLRDFYGDLYPLAHNYYHELNPAFMVQAFGPAILNNFATVTVRDGLAGFGTYVMRNYQTFAKLKCHHFIPEILAPLLPPSSDGLFSCYKIYHPKSLPISQARRVLITGIISQDTIETQEKTFQRMEILKDVPTSTPVDVFLPQRRNPFGTPWKETYPHYELILYLKELMPKHDINFVTMQSLLDQTMFNGIYCLDLFRNPLTLTDNYLNHFIASRGGFISSFETSSDPSSLFELDLSFYHRLQIVPLPKVESIFPELVFYKKQHPNRDSLVDAKFHRLIWSELS